MRVVVDASRCQGTGVCEVTAPELFEVDDDGELVVLQPEPPAALWGKAEQAVRSCPTRALTAERSLGG